MFRINSAFRVEHEALAIFNGLPRFDKCVVLAFQFGAVYGDVQPLKHESKQGNVLNGILTNKDGVNGIEAHGGNIEVRKMIRTENVLLSFIQTGTAFDFVRQDDENKHQLGPPAVDDSHPPESFGKSDGYE